MNLKELAMGQQANVANIRRALHGIPEVRWNEEETARFVKQEVWCIDIIGEQVVGICERKGGLVVDVTINPNWPRVLFRADMDALPIKEATGLPFASTNGRMHACGHDANSAMLLAAFRVMLKTPNFPFTHNLRFVWQRAEENPVTPSGGDVLVDEEGVCDGICAAYALHLITDGPTGAFSSRPGALLGNSGRLGMKIRTSGGHVAEPHKGVNALRVVQQVMNALDCLGATLLPPTEPRILEPAIVQSGTSSNTMPAEAAVWYAARTMLPREEHIKFLAAVEAEVRQVVSGFSGASVEFERVLGHPVTLNTSADVAAVSQILIEAGESYWTRESMLGGEDFAHYLMTVPGAMFMLGANQDGCGPIHSPTFNPDESVLWRGVHFWLLLASTPLV